jgi:hypothetical protein
LQLTVLYFDSGFKTADDFEKRYLTVTNHQPIDVSANVRFKQYFSGL